MTFCLLFTFIFVAKIDIIYIGRCHVLSFLFYIGPTTNCCDFN